MLNPEVLFPWGGGGGGDSIIIMGPSWFILYTLIYINLHVKYVKQSDMDHLN